MPVPPPAGTGPVGRTPEGGAARSRGDTGPWRLRSRSGGCAERAAAEPPRLCAGAAATGAVASFALAMDSAELQAMLDHDERHWWYRGRRRIVCDAVARLGVPPGAHVLDAGCGSGRMLDELARSFAHVAGIELSDEGVALARRRAGGRADVRQGRVEELPWPDGTFGLVLSLDVIEHTPDDRATLRELRRVTTPGVALLLTVPAYQALWSRHDVVNHHFRRYDRRMLRALAAETGWTIERMTSFNSLLLAPAAVVRLAQRGRGGARGDAPGGGAPAPADGAPAPASELEAHAAAPRRAARAAAAGRGRLAARRQAGAAGGAVAAGGAAQAGCLRTATLRLGAAPASGSVGGD